LERGNTLVCLRVRGTSVHIGVRYKSKWHKLAPVSTEMSIEEVEDLRREAIRLARQFQDEEVIPGLARGRSMTVQMLYEEYRVDFRETGASLGASGLWRPMTSSGGCISCRGSGLSN